jgi:hypothetical protein
LGNATDAIDNRPIGYDNTDYPGAARPTLYVRSIGATSHLHNHGRDKIAVCYALIVDHPALL